MAKHYAIIADHRFITLAMIQEIIRREGDPTARGEKPRETSGYIILNLSDFNTVNMWYDQNKVYFEPDLTADYADLGGERLQVNLAWFWDLNTRMITSDIPDEVIQYVLAKFEEFISN
jgi:hypothetical protein